MTPTPTEYAFIASAGVICIVLPVILVKFLFRMVRSIIRAARHRISPPENFVNYGSRDEWWDMCGGTTTMAKNKNS